MNKIYYPIFAALTAVGFASCGSNDTPVVPEPANDGVEVKIGATAIETKAATLEFTNNAKMNIFPKTYNRIDAPNIVDGVVATLEGENWNMSPKVYINQDQKNAFVYAVSPYDASYTDAKNIPVDVNRQVDLMYSGSYQPASMTSPVVQLTMKHALSLLSFNIVPVNYSGQGKLSSLALDGEILYTQGKMDASTGKIELTERGRVEGSFNKTLQSGGWRSDIPGLWSLPFNTKTGVVKITAVIDGKSFEALLPEVEVKTAWQYIFRLALTNNGLEFDPSKTETISLNVNTDENQDFVGFGTVSIESNGGWVNSPVIDGDKVFGTLITPSGASAYDGSVKVEGLKGGDKVTVESWNSDGFTLVTLDGVKTIDISGFE